MVKDHVYDDAFLWETCKVLNYQFSCLSGGQNRQGIYLKHTKRRFHLTDKHCMHKKMTELNLCCRNIINQVF